MFRAALLSVLSLALLARAQIITPPSAVECQPVLLTWTASGTPPYIVSVIPGGQISAAAIENIGTFTNTSVTWKVDIPAGTNITLQMRDGSGQPVYSAPFLVQSNSDTSCLGTNAGYVGGSGLPSHSTAASSGSSTAAGSSSSASASSASASSASASSTSAGVASSTSAGASSTSASSASASSSFASSTSTSAASTSHSSTSTTSRASSSTASAAATSPASAAMAFASVDLRMVGVAGILGALLFA